MLFMLFQKRRRGAPLSVEDAENTHVFACEFSVQFGVQFFERVVKAMGKC